MSPIDMSHNLSILRAFPVILHFHHRWITMPFAQLVIGPPGAGKSTYCNGMHQFLGAIGRKCSIVNLDPANDKTSYPCALDVRDLVTLEEVMSEDHLGPNGGILYALEELEENFDWLEEGLKELEGMRRNWRDKLAMIY